MNPREFENEGYVARMIKSYQFARQTQKKDEVIVERQAGSTSIW